MDLFIIMSLLAIKYSDYDLSKGGIEHKGSQEGGNDLG